MIHGHKIIEIGTPMVQWAQKLRVGHEDPHRVFFGSPHEAIVATDASIDQIKCFNI